MSSEVTVSGEPGEHVLTAAYRAIEVQKATGLATALTFNDTRVPVFAEQTAESVVDAWNRQRRNDQQDRDWTADRSGKSNTSDRFRKLVDEVAALLDGDRFMLMEGREGRRATAGLILANLAHKHRIGPLGDSQDQDGAR